MKMSGVNGGSVSWVCKVSLSIAVIIQRSRECLQPVVGLVSRPFFSSYLLACPAGRQLVKYYMSLNHEKWIFRLFPRTPSADARPLSLSNAASNLVQLRPIRLSNNDRRSTPEKKQNCRGWYFCCVYTPNNNTASSIIARRHGHLKRHEKPTAEHGTLGHTKVVSREHKEIRSKDIFSLDNEICRCWDNFMEKRSNLIC